MARNVGLSFPVGFVVIVITYLYFSTVFVFVDRWLGLWSSPGLMNAAAYTAVAAMLVYSYTVCVLRDPGRVAATYMPDVEDSENPIHEIKRKGGDLRYCQKCSHYKPARSHHCRVCKRCVLRMDHHCIWINNCVGHANYKVFFVFVVYGVIACLYSLVLLLGSLANNFEKDEEKNADSYTVVYIISGILLFPLCVALCVLLGWHIYLVLQNKTTIEYHEGVRAMWLAEKGAKIFFHPYDLGAYQNLYWVQISSVGYSQRQATSDQDFASVQPPTTLPVVQHQNENSPQTVSGRFYRRKWSIGSLSQPSQSLTI